MQQLYAALLISHNICLLTVTIQYQTVPILRQTTEVTCSGLFTMFNTGRVFIVCRRLNRKFLSIYCNVHQQHAHHPRATSNLHILTILCYGDYCRLLSIFLLSLLQTVHSNYAASTQGAYIFANFKSHPERNCIGFSSRPRH